MVGCQQNYQKTDQDFKQADLYPPGPPFQYRCAWRFEGGGLNSGLNYNRKM
jgi:hypothetical protein